MLGIEYHHNHHSTQWGKPVQVPPAWQTGKVLVSGKPASQVKGQLLPTLAAGEVVQSKVPLLNPVMVLSGGGLAHPDAVHMIRASKGRHRSAMHLSVVLPGQHTMQPSRAHALDNVCSLSHCNMCCDVGMVQGSLSTLFSKLTLCLGTVANRNALYVHGR